ncbi:hypothetical protein [Corynebacterium anserum]|nr:hypothetical protein [Corynebacterium anserum]
MFYQEEVGGAYRTNSPFANQHLLFANQHLLFANQHVITALTSPH